MNKSKVLIFGVSAIVLLSFSVLKLWQLFNPVQPALDGDNGIVMPPVNADIENIPENVEINEKDLLIDYLKNNLSRLSPRPEVVGGKFYLTDVVIKEMGLASIAYEDGHMSFNADLKYGFQNNEPFIVDFVITAENGVPVGVDDDLKEIASSTQDLE